jgi:hypothetical protein
MAIQREVRYAALFTRLQGFTGLAAIVKRFERRELSFDQVIAGEQPCLIIVAGRQRPQTQQQGIPTKWLLDAEVAVYARADEPNVVPDTILLNVIDQVELALELAPGEAPGAPGYFQTTLGGRVLRAWISGDIAIDPGVEGNQSIAYFTIEMLVSA